MSCRSTAGGSASTSLARVATHLSDHKVQTIFHALKREGEDAPAPSELDIQAWRHRQEELLDHADISEARKNSLHERLYRSRAEPIPDPATFYALARVEARARQEAVIANIPGIINLAPPGSQADQYVLGEDGRPAQVWYASYGSNLSQQRFLTYLQGGTPPGSTRTYPGCTDPAAPTGDIPIAMPGRMHFALTSKVWGGGGIGFIDMDDQDAKGLGRAYKISAEQFDEVVHFENSGTLAKDAKPVDLNAVLTAGQLTTGPGAYQTMVHVGDHDGAPVFTFTAPFTTGDATAGRGQVSYGNTCITVTANKPSARYLRMIGKGLGQTFGMSEVAQADYLRGCPGGDRWERRDLIQTLRAPEPATPPAVPNPASTLIPGSTGRTTFPLSMDRIANMFSSLVGTAHTPTPQPAPKPAPAKPRRHTPADPAAVPRRRKNGAYFPKVAKYPTVDAQRKGIRTWTACVHRQADKIAILNTRLASIQHHITAAAARDETPSYAVIAQLVQTTTNLAAITAAHQEALTKRADATGQKPKH